ncbi:MAG: ABC transporter permease [Candidatus Limnocylindrales bacterium]|jgi:simple sugar transport system permease protein
MNHAVAPVAQPRGRSPITAFTNAWASQIGITAAFLVLWLAFIIGAPSTFLSDRIYLAYAQTIPYFAVVALFLTMVIIAGDIDLSFISIMPLSLVGFVFTWQATGSVELGVAACVAVGALCGLFNGLIVTFIGIPSLVVTIGTQFLFLGLTLILVNGRQYPLVDTNTSISYWLLSGKIGTIPIPFFWLIALAVVAWFLLNRHRLGQNAYIIGDNPQAAQLMGIPTKRTRCTLFVLTGIASAIAALMNAFSLNNFYPNLGQAYLLPTLAAVFVGGTSVFGGRGTIYGTLLGAFMIGAIEAGIVAVGLSGFYTQFVYGAIVLAAVSIHALLQRRFE